MQNHSEKTMDRRMAHDPERQRYAYAYPEPPGFADHPAVPPGAFHSQELGEFLFPTEVVAAADDPDATLTQFLQTTHEAAAIHAGWDRAALEDHPDRQDQHKQ